MNKSIIKSIMALAFAIIFLLGSIAMGEQENSASESYNYLDNRQYTPFVEMFKLSKKETADVVFVGDSLTARGAFSEFFQGIDVVNRGIGSDITEGVYHRIDQVINLSPKVVFIMIGINDIEHNILPEITMSYLKKICEEIHFRLPNTIVVIQSVLPRVDKEDNDRQIQELNTEYCRVCNEEEYLLYLNLYDIFISESNIKDYYSMDGVHLSGKGYYLWIEAINTVLKKVMEGNYYGIQ